MLVHRSGHAGDDEPVPVAERSWFQEALAEPDPRQSVRLHARNVTRMHQQAGDVVEVLRAAGGADEELRTLWQTAERERRADAAAFIDALRRKGPLRAGLDRDSAIDIVWLFTGPEAFQRLVRARRWSLPRYQEWLAPTFLDQLLPPPATGSPTTGAGCQATIGQPGQAQSRHVLNGILGAVVQDPDLLTDDEARTERCAEMFLAGRVVDPPIRPQVDDVIIQVSVRFRAADRSREFVKIFS